jgi:hypothetical protein
MRCSDWKASNFLEGPKSGWADQAVDFGGHNSRPRQEEDESSSRVQQMMQQPQPPTQRKYIFINGVMKLNPNWNQTQPTPSPAPVQTMTPIPTPTPVLASSSSSTPAPSEPPTLTIPVVEPLQVISSLDDIIQATDAQSDATGVSMQLADTTVRAINNTQGDEYLSQVGAAPATGAGAGAGAGAGNATDSNNVVLEGLTQLFSQYEIPIGLINKLLALADYRLNFIIDDSGSMR